MTKMEQIQAKVVEIAKKHGKAAALDFINEVLPLCGDAVAEAIPGEIDNMVINGAMQPLQKTLTALVEGL